MSIKGFSVNGQIELYDFEALANMPSIGDMDELETTDKSSLVAAINEVAEGGGGGGASPYTSDPEPLGTASPGESNKYARGDHTHPKPSPADIGAGTYSKPSGGIPKTDLASAVQESLGRADTALQSYTETDPTVPSWAKASSKPSYTASEVGAIAAPSSPTTGQFLKWNGSAWVASDLPVYSGGVS